MDHKLKVKDFISIGIFTAVYLVVFMAVIMGLGFMPLLYFFSPAINALILAPVFMLFIARTPKKFAVVIMGFISSGVIALMMPAFWPIYVFPIVCVILAEILIRKADFKDFKFLTIAYVIFSNWVMGIFSSFWIFKDKFLEHSLSNGYPKEYVDGMEALIRPGILIAMYVAVIVLAIVGSFIAKSMLKKHFKKAGII